MAQLEDIAEAAGVGVKNFSRLRCSGIFAGPAGRYITGQTIHVNGGAFLP